VILTRDAVVPVRTKKSRTNITVVSVLMLTEVGNHSAYENMYYFLVLKHQGQNFSV
jgi:hypothetical protein